MNIKKIYLFMNLKLKLIYAWLNIKVSWLFKSKLDKSNNDLDKEVIISLTSYPPRFKTLHLTLQSLLLQTVHIDNVILWIAYQDKNKLTNKIIKLTKFGLKIKFCNDIKSYKKIIPALEENQNRYIITTDDDVYYEKNFVKKLITVYKKYPENVIANRTHIIKYDETKKTLLPYNKWIHQSYDNIKPEYNFLTGVSGVLYPPNCFYKDICKSDIFLKLAPNADDVWLYWMIRLNNKYIYNAGNNPSIIIWFNSQKSALSDYNIALNGNDIQIKNLIEKYGIPINNEI